MKQLIIIFQEVKVLLYKIHSPIGFENGEGEKEREIYILRYKETDRERKRE
jgi:hypothetical protein